MIIFIEKSQLKIAKKASPKYFVPITRSRETYKKETTLNGTAQLTCE